MWRWCVRVLSLFGVMVLLAGCESGPGALSLPSLDAVAQSAGQDNYDALVRQGDAAMAAGAHGRARGAYQQALQARSRGGEALIGLAEASIALGDHDATGRMLDRLEAGAGGEASGRVAQARGILHLRTGQTDAAERALRAAVARDRTLWRAWAALGRVHDRQGDAVSARAAFAEAERHAPDNASLNNDIGMSFVAIGKPREAMPYFEKALTSDPDHLRARANLRIARALTGDYDAAVSGVSAAHMADALSNAGYAAILNGDLDTADRMLRRAIEVSPVHHVAAAANLDLLAAVRTGKAQPGKPRFASSRESAVKQAAEAPVLPPNFPQPPQEPSVAPDDASGVAIANEPSPAPARTVQLSPDLLTGAESAQASHRLWLRAAADPAATRSLAPQN